MDEIKFNPLEIKNEKGRVLSILRDFADIESYELNVLYGQHLKRMIYAGEVDLWLRQQNYCVLADKLKGVENSLSDYLFSIHLWSKQPKYRKINFSQLSGYEEQKRILMNESKTWLASDNMPNHFSPEAILLYGPPGTGKTKLSIAAATQNNGMCIHRSAASIESPGLISNLFEISRNFRPATFIIDEIDELSRPREFTSNGQLTSTLLTELDGVENNQKMLVIGITNYPWLMDNALLRSGRFSKRIYVGTPTLKERKQILEQYLKDTTYSKNLINKAAKLTEYYSCADLRQLVGTTIRECFRKQGAEKLILTTRDITKVIDDMTPTTILWFEKLKATDPPKEIEKYFPEMVKALKDYEKRDFKQYEGLIT